MKKFFFYLVTFIFVSSICVGILYIAYPHIIAQEKFRIFLSNFILLNMSNEEKDQLYRKIAKNTGFYWDTVPEHLVARIAKPGTVTTSKGAEIKINNAGFRSSKDFNSKPENEFRIVCLGDSFVFGEGGKEEDRFSNQIEQIYNKHNITVDGKIIKTYAVGLGSWTAVQEATYLSSRISAYDPDIIIVLNVANDISTLSGVTGGGTITSNFSPEYRHQGSGVFNNQAGVPFALGDYTVFTTDLCPESRKQWDKSMMALKRLTDLQHRRNKLILLSILEFTNPYVTALYNCHGKKLEIPAPSIIMDFFPHKNSLPHDSHPARSGHSVIASHYVHALNKLGWITLPEQVANVIPLDKNLSLDTEFRCDDSKLKDIRDSFRHHVGSSIFFDKLETSDVVGFLGGIFPERRGKESFNTFPWASIRSGFILKRHSGEEKEVHIKIQIPSLVELYPFQITLLLNGEAVSTHTLEMADNADPYTIKGVIPTSCSDDIIEVILETDSYFTTISDHRMKSFRLISAELF